MFVIPAFDIITRSSDTFDPQQHVFCSLRIRFSSSVKFSILFSHYLCNGVFFYFTHTSHNSLIVQCLLCLEWALLLLSSANPVFYLLPQIIKKCCSMFVCNCQSLKQEILYLFSSSSFLTQLLFQCHFHFLQIMNSMSCKDFLEMVLIQ
jgi:hypothetical protein